MAGSDPKFCLITGGTGGVGFETAKVLLNQGCRVMLAGRDVTRGNEAVQKLIRECQVDTSLVQFVTCDLASLKSVRACAEKVVSEHPRLDVLVCNAAVIASTYQQTEDGFELQYQTNHLSHVLLTHLLLPALHKSQAARVVIVSSLLHKRVRAPLNTPSYIHSLPATARYQGMDVYAATKLCNLWFCHKLSTILPPNVVCNAVTPGFIPTTGLGRNMSIANSLTSYLLSWLPVTVTPKEGGLRVANVCIGEEEGKVSGKYFSARKVAASSADSLDSAKSDELFKISCQALGLENPFSIDSSTNTG